MLKIVKKHKTLSARCLYKCMYVCMELLKGIKYLLSLNFGIALKGIR
jgi:hypothetical protein